MIDKTANADALTSAELVTPRGTLLLSAPEIMGIINATPDSFNPASRVNTLDAALFAAETLISDGATWLDIGGESTRPGAEPVDANTDLTRCIPVLEAIKKRFSVKLSVDTRHPEVMQAAIDLEVDMINDVQALSAPKAIQTLQPAQTAVCLMHMQGNPQNMQINPHYPDNDIIKAQLAFLSARIKACTDAGIDQRRIIIDPGFGFGKTMQQNWQLMRHLARLAALNRPILVGFSCKKFIGETLKAAVEERSIGSAMTSIFALLNGASIIRTHEAKWTRQACQLIAAYLNDSSE